MRRNEQVHNHSLAHPIPSQPSRQSRRILIIALSHAHRSLQGKDDGERGEAQGDACRFCLRRLRAGCSA